MGKLPLIAGYKDHKTICYLVADVWLTFERYHILETRPHWDRDRRIRHARILIADVLDEQQHQHIILVLAGIHAAA